MEVFLRRKKVRVMQTDAFIGAENLWHNKVFYDLNLEPQKNIGDVDEKTKGLGKNPIPRKMSTSPEGMVS